MFSIRSPRMITAPSPWRGRYRQLKPSFNKSGESSFGAGKALSAARPRAKTASPRHGNDHFDLSPRSGGRPFRPPDRPEGLLAAILRPGVRPLPARTALHARPGPGLSGEIWLRGLVPREIRQPLTLQRLPPRPVEAVNPLARRPVARDHGD